MDRHKATTTLPLLVIALLAGLAHMLTNGQYGFHRDEWQFLSDARRLDWIGWPELVAQVAAIRDSLPAAEQANLGIAVGNYGEYGAIALLGPAYHLPVPVTTINSGWLRGYPEPAPSTYIVLGNSLTRAEEILTKCRVAGHSSNTLGIVNEESRDHPDILICGPSRVPLDELWRRDPEFG